MARPAPPPRRAGGFLGHPGPIPFAHRGGAAEAPENSWAAFERAVSLGYLYIETDVHVSADGIPVLCHDPDLRRVAGVDITIAGSAWAEISRHVLADGRPPPRLDDALGAWPQVKWNIDLKDDACVGPTVEVLRRCRAQDRALLASFSGARTARARDLLGTAVAISAGRREIAAFALASRAGLGPGAVRRLVGGASDALQVPARYANRQVVSPELLDLAHRAGKVVHVWTVDDPREMHDLLQLGVDGVMTDRPSLLKQVLGASWNTAPVAGQQPGQASNAAGPASGLREPPGLRQPSP